MASYGKEIETAIDYIEQHLDKPLQADEVALLVNFSYYHFHRIFYECTGETIGDYIRKRRLTEAAICLLQTERSIFEISLDYQFDSQASFSRSFKKQFGMSPYFFRKQRRQPISLQKMPLVDKRLKHRLQQISLQPSFERIETERFVIGVKDSNNLHQNQFTQIWQRYFLREREIGEKQMICNPDIRYGICTAEMPLSLQQLTELTAFYGIAAIEVKEIVEVPKGMVAHTIQPGEYAVFRHQGTGSELRTTYDYIWGTWFASVDYELDARDNFEVYGTEFTHIADKDSIILIYIPIKKR
ncbi:helix-turn-helix domain-containing protein [Brevibacillus laterosporus]|uniref:GyrI-like domain-containing protein n=1 Tax=Brevibacillus laterosporus TaxID=1465 RepID=UPI0024067268|nr:GyrI-like domain-containing protein [Brevibacillus laterosporus]MDF9413553.1 helix-turn-helix domain-containing protein [Brevibacillus laterosporus]